MKYYHLISHTHWDREWYLTFQQFRLKLVHLMNKLLSILDSEPEYQHFMLDGQTIVLEDYLELYPEKKPVIQNFISSGKILYGPWYVLPDEFLVSPEALIRNLLVGKLAVKEFGELMPVGYIPDPFGHISQMPQILQGFNIKFAAFRRGLSDEPCELYWQSPDGSKVLTAYLRDGYDNAVDISTESNEAFTKGVRRCAQSLEPFCATDHLLLMNGTDHTEPSSLTPSRIAETKKLFAEDVVLHSTLPAYFESIEKEIQTRHLVLPFVFGELRSPKRHELLPAVLSARTWIKQRNHACENLLERWAEPFSTWANLLNKKNQIDLTFFEPRPILQLSWKTLLKCHPHDSICGCSIDQVHEEMKTRFDQVDQIGEVITNQSFEIITKNINTQDHAPEGSFAALEVFNASPFPNSGFVNAELILPAGIESFDILDDTGIIISHQDQAEAQESLTELELDNESMKSMVDLIQDGQVSGMKILDASLKPEVEVLVVDIVLDSHGKVNLERSASVQSDILKYIELKRFNKFMVHAHAPIRTKTIWLAESIPPFGYRTYWVTPSNLKSNSSVSSSEQPNIENEFFVIKCNQKTGALDILDKSSGRFFSGVNQFIDSGDCGDEYNYCAPENDTYINPTLKQVNTTHFPSEDTMEIELELSLPASLSSDRQSRSVEMMSQSIKSRITLIKGIRRIDFFTEIINNAKDHRLQVIFPTDLKINTFKTDNHFDWIQRTTEIPIGETDWREQPVPEVPQRLFCFGKDSNKGFALVNRGMYEIRGFQNNEGFLNFTLTLLRCIGWLSRGDLPVRPRGAGPTLETPGAQEIGTHEFHYAIVPFEGDIQLALPVIFGFDLPLRGYTTSLHAGVIPPSCELIKNSNPQFIITCIKPAEDGDGWIVRGYNPTELALQVEIQPWRNYYSTECKIDESVIPAENNNLRKAFHFEVPHNAIGTFRFTEEK